MALGMNGLLGRARVPGSSKRQRKLFQAGTRQVGRYLSSQRARILSALIHHCFLTPSQSLQLSGRQSITGRKAGKREGKKGIPFHLTKKRNPIKKEPLIDHPQALSHFLLTMSPGSEYSSWSFLQGEKQIQNGYVHSHTAKSSLPVVSPAKEYILVP